MLLFEFFEIGKETGKDDRRHYAWNNIPDFGDAAGLLKKKNKRYQ